MREIDSVEDAHQLGTMESLCGQQQCSSFSCDRDVYEAEEEVSQEPPQPIAVTANTLSMGGA